MHLNDADFVPGGEGGGVEGAELFYLLEEGLAVVGDEGAIEGIGEL